MNAKFVFVLIISYTIAFTINLMPSIKHPDLNIKIYNLLTSTFFLMVLIIITINSKSKLPKIYLICGIIAGMLVYILKIYEDIMFDYFILDAIASIQYPLYLIFITPLFGINMLFDFSYAAFACFMSLLYLLILILGGFLKPTGLKFKFN